MPIKLDNIGARKDTLKSDPRADRTKKNNIGHAEDDGFDALYFQIGSKIRQFREARGYTTTALAKAAGMGRTSLVNLELNGQRAILGHLYLLAYLLDVSIYDLLPEQLPGLDESGE